MIEKHRLYEQQYLHNIVTSDLAWHTLNYGSIACRASGNFDPTWIVNPGWLEVLPWRKAVYLKNQGDTNDNSTDLSLEVYFNNYTINKFKSVGCATPALATTTTHGLGYNPTSGLFVLNTGGTFTPVTGRTPNRMYLELMPFGPQDSNMSDHAYLSAVCTDVTLIGGNVYSFDIATLALPYTGPEQVKQMIISNLTIPRANNVSFHAPTFYQYEAVTPTTERGLILDLGETYFAELTYDICIWYRAIATADIGATLVLQQLR
jgi:hypothetical protein